MDLPQNLLVPCQNMLPGGNQRGRADAATLKRSISAAYYPVFSLLVHAAARMLARNGSERKELRGYVARAFDHYEMAEACKGFAGGNLNKGSKPCLQAPISTDLKDIAATFQSSRQSRHNADCNILQKPKKTDVRQAVRDAERVFRLWEKIKGSEETRLFLLAMLLDERARKRG